MREKFPPVGKHGRRGVGNGCKNPTVLAEPTDAPVGSEEKLAVLIARAEAGLNLWHPDDSRRLA